MTDNLDELNAYGSPPFERISVNGAWIDAAAKEVELKVFGKKGYSDISAKLIAGIIHKHYCDRLIHAMRATQTPTTGIGAVIGKWPGDETDEEINKELKELD